MTGKTTKKRLGERIRALRISQGMTLQQVATLSGLSIGFISQIERNITGMSLSSMVNVAKALNISLRDLVPPPGQASMETHQDQRKVFKVDDTSPLYERLSTVFSGSSMHAVKFVVPVGYKDAGFMSNSGEEFLYLLSGNIKFIVGEKTYLLGPGDSLHFDGLLPHRYSNNGKDVALILWVGTFPIFGDLSYLKDSEQKDTAHLFGTEVCF